MTPSNGNIFHVTGHLCGEFTGHRWIPCRQRPVTGRFHVLFDLRLNKLLSKQSWGWWFETPITTSTKWIFTAMAVPANVPAPGMRVLGHQQTQWWLQCCTWFHWWFWTFFVGKMMLSKMAEKISWNLTAHCCTYLYTLCPRIDNANHSR